MTLSNADIRIERDIDNKVVVTLEKKGFLLQWCERLPSTLRYQSSRIPPMPLHGGGFPVSDMIRFLQMIEEYCPYWTHEYNVKITPWR